MSRLVQVLFLVSLLGVLVCVGLVVADLAGTWAAVAYGVVALVLLVAGSARARAAQAAARPAAAQACSCCDGDHTKPVTVR